MLVEKPKTTSLHIFRGPKNEKGKQLGALIEVSGHFPIRAAEICVKELRLGHIFNGL